KQSSDFLVSKAVRLSIGKLEHCNFINGCPSRLSKPPRAVKSQRPDASFCWYHRHRMSRSICKSKKAGTGAVQRIIKKRSGNGFKVRQRVQVVNNKFIRLVLITLLGPSTLDIELDHINHCISQCSNKLVSDLQFTQLWTAHGILFFSSC